MRNIFLSRLISSLRKKVSPVSPATPVALPPTGFCALPRDILLCIADALPLETRICLALTCRGLYTSLFSKPERPGLRLDAIEKQALLLRIEKDVPSLHYCYSCMKLRPWKHLSGYAVSCTLPKQVCSSSDSHHYFLVTGYFLYHTCARLVMMRRLPVSCIETEDSYMNKQYDVERHQAWRAKIIDDRLYLCTTYTIRQRQGDAQRLRDFFNSYGYALCYHLVNLPPYTGPRNSRYRIQQMESPRDGSYFSACTAAVKRCTTCQTDFEVDISKRGREGWVVKVVAYRMLGKCLDPSEESWRCITSPKYDFARDGRRDFGLPGVREVWLEDEIARSASS